MTDKFDASVQHYKETGIADSHEQAVALTIDSQEIQKRVEEGRSIFFAIENEIQDAFLKLDIDGFRGTGAM